jgi:hypothetical protein
MIVNDFPFVVSLSSRQLTLYPETIGTLSATALSNGYVPEKPVQITFGGDDSLEFSTGDGNWTTEGVSPTTHFLSGTATIFIRSRAGVRGDTCIEVFIPGKSTPQICRVRVLGSGRDSTHQVASLMYVSGSDQFGWDVSTGSVFNSPLVVRALNCNGQPVVDARVTFSVNSPSAAMSSTVQFTDAVGQTNSAFLIAKQAEKEFFTVTAECNGHQIHFTGLAVVAESLTIEISPAEISVGRMQVMTSHLSWKDGVVWAGLPFLVRLEADARRYFSFTEFPSDSHLTLKCDTEGKGQFQIDCLPDTSPGQQGVLVAQSGPTVRSMVLVAKDA